MNTIHGSFTNAATGKTLACGTSVSSLLIFIYIIETKLTLYQRVENGEILCREMVIIKIYST